MKKYYRIVEDDWLGYEVQRWRWWFPFWVQCCGPNGICNTHSSLEEAERFVKCHAAGFVLKSVTIE